MYLSYAMKLCYFREKMTKYYRNIGDDQDRCIVHTKSMVGTRAEKRQFLEVVGRRNEMREKKSLSRNRSNRHDQ